MNARLQTERLLLRLCTIDGLNLFRTTWGNAEVMQTFGPGTPVLPKYIEQRLFGIDELNPYQIVATVIPDHVASRRVLEKAGLSYSHNIPEWNRNLYAIKNPTRADE